MERALTTVFPALGDRVAWLPLGEFPTPLEAVEVERRSLWVKRDDLSSPLYGGNKVRTLEVLFGAAKRAGCTRIYSTGAFGSNHATATVMHAPRVGLEPGVILFPQPVSLAALENLRVMLRARPVTHALPHWAFLPLGMARARAADRRAGVRSEIMVPGGATATGALGYVSAALELAQQVERGEMPAPRAIVVGIGSTCTSAGLLLGLRVAAELGLGWRSPPKLVSARVTPWPVTSPRRVVNLALDAARLLGELASDARWTRLGRRELARGLEVDRRYLGRGYGHATSRGREVIERWRAGAGFELDTTYSAKAAACALDRAARSGPVLYWSTKSSASLPAVDPDDWRWGPRRMVRWIEAAERQAG